MSNETIYNEEQKQIMNEIVTKTRALLEKEGFNSANLSNYLETSEKTMKKLDEIHEKQVAELAAQKKREEELKERLKNLENVISMNSGPNGDEEKKEDSIDVMNALLKNNWNRFIEDEKNFIKAKRIFDSYTDVRESESEVSKMAQIIGQVKTTSDVLRSDIGEIGGFLCPPEYSNELAKNLIEKSPVRQFARVKTTSNKIYRQPIRVGIPIATRPGETRQGGKSISNYVMEDWTPGRMTNTLPVTVDELLYEKYNLAQELLEDNNEAFAVKESQEFFNGSGVVEGLGWSVDANVPEFTTATTTLTADDMISISGELKQGYNPMYMFNRRTLVYLRLLKDSTNRYLWSGPFGDFAPGAAQTINGLPYSAAFIDFDDFDVSGGFPVLFADMSKFYLIVDRSDTTIIRDEFTRKTEAIIEYTMNRYTFGKPWIKEAGIRMKRKV